ncbi:ROK family protein [Bacillus sp. Marseille-P3661]|uniref:ROK family protein n=1 Tax=Bacillus sp. Marseille-P3661 TaxID=1936234 RepID=UPI000C828901|nr:ROK family protein [Bacillus sp. Marseille-P3661]
MLRTFLEDHSQKNKLKKSLYQLIHRYGVISKVDLINEMNIPQTTLNRMLRDLEEKGLIRLCGYGESSGGRPPVLYEAIPNASYVIGIEIARTHVNIILQNIKFELIDQEYFTMTNEHTSEKTLNNVIEIIHSLLVKYSLDIDMIVGIGVGAVGPLNRESGIILTPDAFLAEGWGNVKISSMLTSEFPVPIVLNNAANTAALAEYKISNSNDEDILYCISGYGLRCGFINKGRFLNIREGDASSFGHMIIEPNGRKCSCGKRGCVNAYVSFHAIFKCIEETLENEKDNFLLNIQGIEDLLGSLNCKEDVVRQIVLRSGYFYGLAIANMINILHPSTVILQGKLISHSNEYYNHVVKTAEEHIYTVSSSKVLIKKGELGENAPAIGAAMEVFYSLFD